MTTASAQTPIQQFPCSNCGANLEFAPGTTRLVCPHCGTTNQIAQAPARIPWLDFQKYADAIPAGDAAHERIVVKCTACGAESQLPADVAGSACPFCGSPIVAESSSKKFIKPQGLLPFAITREQADRQFHAWIKGLWFAPSGLAGHAQGGGLKGIYLPCWTYDARSQTPYTGERGDDYQESESVFVNGRTETRTVTKTRWRSASGSVNNTFADLLVLATTSLPEKYLDALEPWDLAAVAAYDDRFTAGFTLQSYQIDLRQGFDQARTLADPVIRQSIEQDIGGDHQRIESMEPRFFDITFRHLLLPVWVSAYMYGGKTYLFMVNARSGEVSGQRPYSALKIGVAVAAAIALVILIVILAYNSRS